MICIDKSLAVKFATRPSPESTHSHDITKKFTKANRAVVNFKVTIIILVLLDLRSLKFSGMNESSDLAFEYSRILATLDLN